MANWFTSPHPDPPFTNILMMERLTPEARNNLVGLRLTERRRDGAVNERMLSDPAELGEALDQVFGVEPPVPAEALFARMPKD